MAEYLVIRLDPDRDKAANWIAVDDSGTRISPPVTGPLSEAMKDVGDRAVIVLVPANTVTARSTPCYRISWRFPGVH